MTGERELTVPSLGPCTTQVLSVPLGGALSFRHPLSLWPVDTAGLSAFTRSVRAYTILFFSQVIPWSTEMLVHQHAGFKVRASLVLERNGLGDRPTRNNASFWQCKIQYDVFRDPKTKCTCCQIENSGQAVLIAAIFSVEPECEPMILALSQFYRSPSDTLPTRPPTLH